MKLILVLLVALAVGLSNGKKEEFMLRQDPMYIDQDPPVFIPDGPLHIDNARPPPPIQEPIQYYAGPIDTISGPGTYDEPYMTSEEYLAYVYGPLSDDMYDPYLYDNRHPARAAF